MGKFFLAALAGFIISSLTPAQTVPSAADPPAESLLARALKDLAIKPAK